MTDRTTRSAASLAASLAVVLLAGCGDSPLSHSAFVTKANAICADYHTRVAKLALPHTVSDYETYARRTLPLYRQALRQLEALHPPRVDEATVSEWLSRDRMIEQDITRIASAAHARNVPKLNAAIASSRTHDERSAELATRLGLRECATA